MICTMHFPSIKSPFAFHFFLSFISYKWPSYIIYTPFPFTCRCQNNEHENDSVNGQGFDFERVVYTDEFGNDENMEDNDLPSNLLRLDEQDERQILSHRDITKAINLGTEEERREVKIETTLSPTTINGIQSQNEPGSVVKHVLSKPLSYPC